MRTGNRAPARLIGKEPDNSSILPSRNWLAGCSYPHIARGLSADEGVRTREGSPLRTNGRDAVDIAIRERPDLLMIDLNMPEMDGYEAITRVRREMSLPMMPVLVLTSEGPGVERRVLELGADDYILKSFDPEVLLSRVNAVFRRLKVMAA